MRSVSLATGLLLFAIGIVFLLESGLGLSPWDVLNQGISEHTSLSFGTTNIVIALGVLVLAWALGARIGPGTVANAVFIGLFVDGLLVKTVSERASTTVYRRVLYVRSLTSGPHTIRIESAGGGRVDLDAILTLK